MPAQEQHLSAHLLKLSAALFTRVTTSPHAADREVHLFLRQQPHLKPHERARLATFVDGMLRHRRRLELTAQTRQPDLLACLYALAVERISPRNIGAHPDLLQRAAERLHATPVPQDPAESLAFRYSLPPWLAQRLLDIAPDGGAEDLAASLRQRPPTTLRANTLRHTRDEVQHLLAQEGIDAHPTPLSPVGLTLDAWAPVLKTQTFQSGAFELQDEGSQLLALLTRARPGQTLIDACAGAGGKTLHLAALMQNKGSLYAFDTVANRLAALKTRARRAGVHNLRIHPVEGKEGRLRLKRLYDRADAVLIDAPCSGTGALRRNPDDAARFSPEALDDLTALQAHLLQEHAPLVKPGGRLVYATCSLLPEENELIIDRFLLENSSFSLVPAAQALREAAVAAPPEGDRLRLWPHLHNTDGFFAAVLLRR